MCSLWAIGAAVGFCVLLPLLPLLLPLFILRLIARGGKHGQQESVLGMGNCCPIHWICACYRYPSLFCCRLSNNYSRASNHHPPQLAHSATFLPFARLYFFHTFFLSGFNTPLSCSLVAAECCECKTFLFLSFATPLHPTPARHSLHTEALCRHKLIPLQSQCHKARSLSPSFAPPLHLYQVSNKYVKV